MYLTKEEIRIAVYALVFGADDQHQKFGLEQLATASDCFKQLNLSVDAEKNYLDGEVELNTSEKSLILECLKRSWRVADGAHVLSLKEKLEK